MRPFTLVVPHDLKEAAAAAGNPGAALKAGGIDLIDRLKERIESPAEVVNLLPLKADLAGIAAEEGGLRIGALTTLAQLEQSAALQHPALAALQQAAAQTASPQIRNRATVAGNLLQLARCWYLRSSAFGCLHGGKGPACLALTGEHRYHAILGTIDCIRVHPSNLAPALLLLEAEYSTLAGDQPRRRKLAELFPAEPRAEAAEHTLEPGEILTAIHVPSQSGGTRSCYRESREKQGFDWATTAAAVRLELADGRITGAAIVLGAVAPVPWPVPAAAKLLVGKAPGAELFREVADAAYADAVPGAQNGYKVQVGKAVLREALQECTR